MEIKPLTRPTLKIIDVIHDEVDMNLVADPHNSYEVRDAILEYLSDKVRLSEVFSYFSSIPFVVPTFDFEMDNNITTSEGVSIQYGSFQPTASFNPFQHRLDRLKKQIETEAFNPFVENTQEWGFAN